MNKKRIVLVFTLLFWPCLSIGAIIEKLYGLTDNSHFTYLDTTIEGEIIEVRTSVTGVLLTRTDDVTNIVTLDYSYIYNEKLESRGTDILITDSIGISSESLIAGFGLDHSGDYFYGNAALDNAQCGIVGACYYEMTYNLDADSLTGPPLVLSFELSGSATYEERFELYVSEVPIPASIWLLSSGLIGFFVIRKRENT